MRTRTRRTHEGSFSTKTGKEVSFQGLFVAKAGASERGCALKPSGVCAARAASRERTQPRDGSPRGQVPQPAPVLNDPLTDNVLG
jgi:hypothetical protein